MVTSCSSINNHRILLTGDVELALFGADIANQSNCHVCTEFVDAIEAASENQFTAIGVVVSGAAEKLSSVLKALRKGSPNAKIVLLVQMHEEPIALKLIGAGYNGSRMADDYLICPISFSNMVSNIFQPWQNKSVESEAIVSNVIDEGLANKIAQLEKLATTDELTGLKNRRYVWEFAKQIIEFAKKENKYVTLLVFDIDDFKHYNDVYSHSAGDEILKQAAVLMKRCCRSHDVVGRIGGDEFAVIFWDDPNKVESDGGEAERRLVAADHPKEAIFIANRFRGELKNTELSLLGPEGKGVLAISGGLASFPRDGSTIQELFEQADEALFEAKRSGKNRIYLVGESDITEIR